MPRLGRFSSPLVNLHTVKHLSPLWNLEAYSKLAALDSRSQPGVDTPQQSTDIPTVASRNAADSPLWAFLHATASRARHCAETPHVPAATKCVGDGRARRRPAGAPRAEQIHVTEIRKKAKEVAGRDPRSPGSAGQAAGRQGWCWVCCPTCDAPHTARSQADTRAQHDQPEPVLWVVGHHHLCKEGAN